MLEATYVRCIADLNWEHLLDPRLLQRAPVQPPTLGDVCLDSADRGIRTP